MATLKLTFNDPNITSTTMTRDFFIKSRHQELNFLVDYLRALNSGTSHGSGSVVKASNLNTQTQAAATVTLASVSANDTVTVGNIVYTAKTSAPTGNQWLVGVSDTADAAALVVVLNANASLSPYMVATSALGVVTLTSIALGALGNLLALTSSNNTRLAVVGFASGVDATITTYNF